MDLFMDLCMGKQSTCDVAFAVPYLQLCLAIVRLILDVAAFRHRKRERAVLWRTDRGGWAMWVSK
jgi:hypothetical protein